MGFHYILNPPGKQTVKILMRGPSNLDFHCLQRYVQIYLMSGVTQLDPSTTHSPSEENATAYHN